MKIKELNNKRKLKMRAFHNDPKIKEKYLKRVLAHQKADEIIKGKYWENGKGCAVGCTLHSSKHSGYETELGIDRSIAHLQDNIFEGLEDSEAKLFPYRFLSSIKVGANLSLVVPEFILWSLVDDEYGVINFAEIESVKESIKKVASLYSKIIEGEIVSSSEWKTAKRNAHAAYADACAAAAAADAYTADAADAAAYATYTADAADAADAAAYATYTADAAYATYTATYIVAHVSYNAAAAYVGTREEYRSKQANKLIELLTNS